MAVDRDASRAGDLDAARRAADQGHIDRAAAAYERVLLDNPDLVEALHFLGTFHAQRGETAQAELYLLRAVDLAPGHAPLLVSLSEVSAQRGDAEASYRWIERAGLARPAFPPAILELGLAEERRGRRMEALRCYVTAIAEAQRSGRWVSAQTTPEHLHERLGHAMRFVQKFAGEEYARAIESLRQRFASSELKRVERCLAIRLKQVSWTSPDPRQQPKFLHFPDLPAQPYFPRESFDWVEALESSTDEIVAELERVLAERAGLQPFLNLSAQAQVGDYLRGARGLSGWEAFFFFRHGQRYEDNLARCPVTRTQLERMPLVKIKDAAPEALFSVLAAGAEILPHRGVTNTRSVVHLPLVVPQDCALRVAGEEHVWRRGRVVVFDDTYEHEAWNHSAEDRVVLIADIWNPHLTVPECLALAEVVPLVAAVEQSLRPPAATA